MSIKPSRSAPAGPRLPATAPAHISRRRPNGDNDRGLAADLASRTVHGLLSGRRTTLGTAVVFSATVPVDQVDSGGSRLRLRALHVMGHGSARIARAVGADPRTIRALVRGDARTVSTDLRDAITTVYDTWWDKRPPGRTPAARAAATAARKRAIAGNWCTAANLDDDLLDIPGYQPCWGWKPASGTGTAPDIDPPALRQQRKPRMPDDERFAWGLILEVFDVLERHGYHGSDHEHTGQAIGLIRDLTRTYEGTQEGPSGAYVIVPSPRPPGPPAVIVSSDEVKTLLLALDEAAEYERDRAGTCADCPDQSCTTCQSRLQAADAYDQLAAHMIQAAEASATRRRALGQTPPPRGGPPAAADPEAGQ